MEDDEVEMLRGKSSGILRSLRRVPVIAADMRRLKNQSIDATPLFAGVGPMLGELSQLGVVLALVSSDSEGTSERHSENMRR